MDLMRESNKLNSPNTACVSGCKVVEFLWHIWIEKKQEERMNALSLDLRLDFSQYFFLFIIFPFTLFFRCFFYFIACLIFPIQ